MHQVCQQPRDMSCGTAALCSALYVLGHNTTFEGLNRLRRSIGESQSRVGLFLPQLGIIAHHFGLRTRVVINASDFVGSAFTPPPQALTGEHLRRAIHGIRPAIAVTRWQKILLESICRATHLFETALLPSRLVRISRVLRQIDKQTAAIVRVTVRDYYGLNDNSGHFLTIVAGSARGTALLLDPYAEFGKAHVKDWSRCISHAKKFEWTRWSASYLVVSND